MKLTKEQQDIISHIPAPRSRVGIKALAGTGKTFISVQLCKTILAREPKARILYLAFNKSIAKEGEVRFYDYRANVTCKTLHSLAWSPYGQELARQLTTNLRLTDLDRLLKPSDDGIIFKDKWPFLKAVKATFDNFLMSGYKTFNKRSMCSDSLLRGMAPHAINQVLPNAQHLWNHCADPKCPMWPATHDVYLKLYQLSKPKLDYDYIFIDECQDVSMTTLKLLDYQQAVVYYTGDTYQSLYGFRSSVDAFDKVAMDQVFSLQTSFRFPQRLADQSNLSLRLLGSDLRLVGAGKDEEPGPTDPTCVISRTNVELFKQALNCLEHGMTYHYVGGIKEELFDGMLSAYDMWRGEKVMHPLLRSFKDWGGLCNFARESGDSEACGLVSAVTKHKTALPGLVAKVKAGNSPLQSAGFLLITSHKAKGLEWADVFVTGDYVQEVEDKSTGEKYTFINSDSLKCVYVALTRGEGRVSFHDNIRKVLEEVIPFNDITKVEVEKKLKPKRDKRPVKDKLKATTDQLKNIKTIKELL